MEDQLTTAWFPEQADPVHHVAEEDGAGNRTHQPDDDGLDAQGQGPLLRQHGPDRTQMGK